MSNTEDLEVVVFGGTFDPLHSGHLSAIEFLRNRYRRVVVATTDKNPWKESQPTDFWKRIEMISLVLAAEFIPFQLGGYPFTEPVTVSDFPYVYAKDFVEHLGELGVERIGWAAGPDVAPEMSNWKGWSTLNVGAVSVPEEIPLRATPIRAGEEQLHPALENFVQRNKLYQTAASR